MRAVSRVLLTEHKGLASAESRETMSTGQEEGAWGRTGESAMPATVPSSFQGYVTSLILNKTQGADTFL